MPNYDWLCGLCGFKFEHMANYNVKFMRCKCGGRAQRQFPCPQLCITPNNRLHSNPRFDPIQGTDMDKYEMDYWKHQPYPEGSKYAKSHGLKRAPSYKQTFANKLKGVRNVERKISK